MKEMENNASKAVGLLKGLASHHRLLILCQLVEGEKSVGELIEATSMPQTSMSQHLNKLKEENIVTFRRDHRTLYYYIDSDVTMKIMNILHQEYCN